jgi:hypothetical protein
MPSLSTQVPPGGTASETRYSLHRSAHRDRPGVAVVRVVLVLLLITYY